MPNKLKKYNLVPILLLVLALLTSPLTAMGENNTPSPLNILLINDDGIGAIGIEAMQAALEEAGHNVVVVAPNGDASGASSNANLGSVFQIQPEDVNEFKISRVTDGTSPLSVPVPATPVEIVILSPAVTSFIPDLVISGINNGQNYGLLSFLSGTVAGASVSSTKFSPFGQLPAIAISMVSATSPFPPPSGFTQNFEEAADFVVELIDSLQNNSYQGELIPEGIFLSVNYPALAKEDIKGVKITAQGDSVLIDSVYFPEPQSMQGLPLDPFDTTQFCDITTTGGLCVAAAVPISNNETVKNADTDAVVNGYISIAPFQADYTSPKGKIEDIKARLRELLN